MASILQKLATALARPFTKHLRLHLDQANLAQRKSLLTSLRSDLDASFEIQNKAIRANANEMKTRLIEHSRSIADNLDLLCALQTALREKMDSLAVSFADRNEFVSSRFAFPLDSSRALVRTTVGYMICDRRDPVLLGALIDSRELEPGLRCFIERYLEEGMTFVEVGAHIGMHSIAAGRCVGRKGKVHAFEAVPETAECLRQNVTQNGLGTQVKVYPNFVGTASGMAPYPLFPNGGHDGTIFPPSATAMSEVQVVALDDVLAEVPAVDLVKVNVDGAELEVFAGMRQLLARSPDGCVVASFYATHLSRPGAQVADWKAFCQEHGLEVFVVEEPSGDLRRASFDDLILLETTNVLMARGKNLKTLF